MKSGGIHSGIAFENFAKEGQWIQKKKQEIICYCFGYTREDIRKDILQNGRPLIIERIAAEKRAGAATSPKQTRKEGDAFQKFAGW